jgi:RND superfamily putative drug exporter
MRLAGRAAFWPARVTVGRTDRSEQRWHRVAELVGRRPVAVLLVSIAVLALPAAAATQATTPFNLLAAHFPR